MTTSSPVQRLGEVDQFGLLAPVCVDVPAFAVLIRELIVGSAGPEFPYGSTFIVLDGLERKGLLESVFYSATGRLRRR